MKKITHIVFDHDGTLVDTSSIQRNLYPGMKDLLAYLKDQKVEMMVWTARTRPSTEEILTNLDVIHYFSEICGGNDAASKPSPGGLYHLLPSVKPENVVVIGDSLGDIIGGSKFGAHCIAAMWGHRDASALDTYKEYGAETGFVTVKEFKNYIEELIRGE